MTEATRLRRIPLDLLAVAGLTVIAAVALLVVETQPTSLLDASPGALVVRVVVLALGLAFLLFLPGYALVSVLFPGHEPAVEQLDPEGEPIAPRFRFREREGIDALERVTLAVGVSAVVTPMVALALNFTPWGIRVGPLVVALAATTLAASAFGAVRRWLLPPEKRFAPSLVPSASPLFSGSNENSFGAANVVFAIGLLVALAGIGYAVTAPQPGEQFTEMYLLSEDDNGTLVADDYPEFVAGEQSAVAVGVENHEGQRTDYTLVAELQRVEKSDDGVRVLGAREIDRTEVSLDDGNTRQVPLRLTPREAEAGENLRLRILLFDGPVPEEPSVGSAYRSVSLEIDVAENESDE